MISKGCPLLKGIHLFACGNVGDEGIISLGQNCPRLETANFDGTRVTDEGSY